MSKRVQPPWAPPPNNKAPVLKLYNSLTRRKEVFVPQSGRRVTWYSCGPTVYDASHMGHARSYITFDILRRVLSDYFGYDIFYVMNITDIDDKIIKRARQNYLFERYAAKDKTLEQVLEDAKDVIDLFSTTTKSTNDPDKKQMLETLLERLEFSVELLETEVVMARCMDSPHNILTLQERFIQKCRDPLSEWLDKKLGATVTDNAIFSSLPRHWEQEFHRDMDSLNVLRPDVLTRVSEYIPEIIDYIEKIISNKLAYNANGSVYFDVAEFDRSQQHSYAKLVPEAYGDTASLQEGEGDLTTADQSEKRSPTDFALWKKSKAGEPAWDSPWGKGRPGWHIECSAMASAICGSTLDIHTGGVDLKFPHHDNEIAQSEAYFGSSEWVNYFLHSGHLTIAGCKMSKSLKNFVTIQQALEKYTARQLRFAFLLHSWKDTLDYSQNTMDCAVQFEKLFNEFFLTVKDLCRSLRDYTNINTFNKWNSMELELNRKFEQAKENVHIALCDNIDTRSALDALRELVAASNLYLRDQKSPNALLLHSVANYITQIFTIFGTINHPTPIGFPLTNTNTPSTECAIMPYLTILSKFRENVRDVAKTLKATEILQKCDELRDTVLPNVGVRLEDKNDGSSAVKLVDRETLLKEKEAREELEVEQMLEREFKKAQAAAVKADKEDRVRIPPEEMFRRETDKYSKFGENGIPTHDVDGKELSKGLTKKLQKLQLAQEKRYKEYLATN